MTEILRTLSFPAPAQLITMNQRLHWRARAQLTATWRHATCYQSIAAFGRGLYLPPSIVDIALPVKGNRRRDPSNFLPCLKAATDGLVDAGWWPDDNSNWVRTLEPVLVVGGDMVTITARALVVEPQGAA